MIEFVEQNDNGGVETVRITEAEAIRRQKAASAAHNLAYGLDVSYSSDEAALEDFIVVHWAWSTEPQGAL